MGFVVFQKLTFQVKVTTEDGERSSNKTVVIEVQDINDNSPTFEYPVSFIHSCRQIDKDYKHNNINTIMFAVRRDYVWIKCCEFYS